MIPTYLTREQVRDVDRRAIDEFGMSGLVLMENAGRGCVDCLERLEVTGPVAVICGRGNNAGDGFVIARHLDLRGRRVRVMLLGTPNSLRGDAASNFAILQRCDVPIEVMERFDERTLATWLAGAEWVVDAMLGTGARGAPRAPMDALIRHVNPLPVRRLAIDLPSGLDCDSGDAADPTFLAHHTCTFVAQKVGFQTPSAKPFLGEVHVLDIGVPRVLLERI